MVSLSSKSLEKTCIFLLCVW